MNERSNDGFFDPFERIRIINLVDRADRRDEMRFQLDKLGAWSGDIDFFEATRPADPGPFPSLGARGCFESHLSVLRAARDSGVGSLLILEDDFDFSRDGRNRSTAIFKDLMQKDWDVFHGAHVLSDDGRSGLTALSSDEPVLTASFIGFNGSTIPAVVEFLDTLLTRPAGSPEYGPMHVDGAYTVFRATHPQVRSFAGFPTLGRQRSSRSDITPVGMILDRWSATRPIADILRKVRNQLARR